MFKLYTNIYVFHSFFFWVLFKIKVIIESKNIFKKSAFYFISGNILKEWSGLLYTNARRYIFVLFLFFERVSLQVTKYFRANI
jgi:hypothetical protein